MAGASLTLGKAWISRYEAGMALLHQLMGINISMVPTASLTLDILTQVLQEIVSGSYDPAAHFMPGSTSPPALVLHPPALAPDTNYILISLNASTARSNFVSVDTGGLAFEDPFWAIFAAQAISSHYSVALPMAKDNDELWRNVSLVEDAVKGGRYDAQRFLGKIEGYAPPISAPRFELISVASDQLASLRSRGAQALKVAVPPKFFELFQPAP